MYACFVDFSKAFDTIWRKALFHKLYILNGLSYKFIKLIENMYQGIRCSVKLSNGTTPLFNSYVGLRQGCNLSQMLGGLTSTHNKRGCAVLTKKVVPKNPGNYLKLRPKNPGTGNARLSFYMRKFTTQIRKSLISIPHLSFTYSIKGFYYLIFVL